MKTRAFVRPSRLGLAGLATPDVREWTWDEGVLERWEIAGGVEWVERTAPPDLWDAVWEATLAALDDGFVPGRPDPVARPAPTVGRDPEEAALPPAERAVAAEARLRAAGHPYALFLQRRGDPAVARRVHELVFAEHPSVGVVWAHGFVTTLTVDARRGLPPSLSFDHPSCWYVDTLAVVASEPWMPRSSADPADLGPLLPVDLEEALRRVVLPGPAQVLGLESTDDGSLARATLPLRRTLAGLPRAGEVVWDGAAHLPEDVVADRPADRYPEPEQRDPWGLFGDPSGDREDPPEFTVGTWEALEGFDEGWDLMYGRQPGAWEVEIEDARGGCSPDEAFEPRG